MLRRSETIGRLQGRRKIDPGCRLTRSLQPPAAVPPGFGGCWGFAVPWFHRNLAPWRLWLREVVQSTSLRMTTSSTIWCAIACLIVVGGIFVAVRKRPKQVHETTPGGPYTLTITPNEIACEHPKRDRESIKWDAVTEIRLVTTSEGPRYPDVWLLFVGDLGGCSVPS